VLASRSSSSPSLFCVARNQTNRSARLRNWSESLAAKGLSFDSQSPALVIGKQDTILANVLFEHCYFGLQVLDSLLLLSIDPTARMAISICQGCKMNIKGIGLYSTNL